MHLVGLAAGVGSLVSLGRSLTVCPGSDSPFDPKLALVLSHPLRLALLELLQGREASKRELAESVGTTSKKLDYHLRQLLSADCVMRVDRPSQRGAGENFYTAKPGRFVGSFEWADVPRSVRGVVSLATLRIFIDKLSAAADEARGRNAESVCLTETFRLDDEGWESASQLTEGLFIAMRNLQEQAQARAYVKEAELTPRVLGLAMFDAESLDRGRADD